MVGRARADIGPGTRVALTMTADVPPGAGKIVRVRWDMDGDGTYEVDGAVEPASRLSLERHHTFTRPGTHFVTVCVSAQRDADREIAFARVDNLARARVVVR